ncbi:hypothetical protein IMCC14465_18380 [alpha proteobacterium IMCC14465]|uniref:Glucosamine/galactosamine-6-phosphate isomerase domain-containing protein n=1 Tax=alpha proteobacterium IMCC14465 TaxID=1220535 RepID=J9DE55_9PROT|nr:hypothetical protein IMCC14465_18380 [alpha proteobacterium IMCC14465]
MTIQHPKIEVFDTRDQLNGVAVDRLSKMLGGQSCTLFMSGGSTPGPVYDRLSEVNLDWQNIYVAPADERWVNETDQGSNARIIKETLVKNRAGHVNFIPMKSGHATPNDGALSVEMNYQQLPRPFYIVLGMGADGHIASWFATAPEYQTLMTRRDKFLVAPIHPEQNDITGTYTSRMTITPYTLHMCQKAVLMITGKEKYDLLRSCLEQPDKHLPVNHAINILKSKLTILATI